jgi:hypothetical protein
VAQRQVLRARRGTNRVGLTKPSFQTARFRVVGGKRLRDGEAPLMSSSVIIVILGLGRRS